MGSMRDKQSEGDFGVRASPPTYIIGQYVFRHRLFDILTIALSARIIGSYA